MLASIYNDIPDEEKPDLINAINDNDDSDEELLEIYEQIRELHRKNSGLVLISEPSDGGDINITIDDLMRTLNIS